MNFWGIRLGSIGVAVVGAILVGLIGHAMGTTAERLIGLAGLYITLAVSLNLINGITGQFSIGHAAFYQVGAYSAGAFAMYVAKTQTYSIPLLLGSIVVGGIAAAIAGFVIGLPSLRLRGDYLAVVTLGFGEILRIIIQNTPELGKSYGMSAPALRSLPLIWLLAFLCIAVCRNLLKTTHGLTFLSVREDEVAASAMGVNVTKVKVASFVIGSAFAGMAGALLMHLEGFVTPTSFSMDLSFIVLTMVVLGGTGSITGSVLAAITLFLLPELLRDGPTVPLVAVIAVLVFLGIIVGMIKKLIDDHKFSYAALAPKAGIALVAAVVLGFGSSLLPALNGVQVPSANLRMVIFPVVLIVMMLLRPQGIFGHREIGLATFLRKREVSA